MSSADRVRAALEMQVVDRPPFGWWGHTFVEEWTPEDLAAVTVARQRRFGWDFVKLQPRATCFAEAFGSRYRPSGNALERPVLLRPAVLAPADWENLPSRGAGSPPLADQVAAVAAVAAELGPDVPVLQTVFSPLTVAGYLVGEDPAEVLGQLRARPEPVTSALAVIAGALADVARRSVDAGAAGVFYAISGYASADRTTWDEYEAMVLPHDLRVLEALPADGWFNVAHLCGPAVHFDLSRRLGLPAVSWSVHERGNPSLAEGRERSGRAVMGGLDHVSTLVAGPAEAVVAETESAVADTGGRGLLVAPGCSVPPEAPERHLLAIRSALGRRPDARPSRAP